MLEPNGSFVRDPDLYYLTVFGKPSMVDAWAIRYEGHHLAFNWTFVQGAGIASTPQFFGSNPAEVRDGEKQGTRVLAIEEDLGRQLLKSLNEMQRRAAVLSGDAPARHFYCRAEADNVVGRLWYQLRTAQFAAAGNAVRHYFGGGFCSNRSCCQ